VTEGYGERFRNARLDAGYTQAEVEERIKEAGLYVSNRSLSSWENEEHTPRGGPVIRFISDLYAEPLAWLLRGDESARARASHRGHDPGDRA
jgi:transcriptional regulator with XRE-family HTH domain